LLQRDEGAMRAAAEVCGLRPAVIDQIQTDDRQSDRRSQHGYHLLNRPFESAVCQVT